MPTSFMELDKFHEFSFAFTTITAPPLPYTSARESIYLVDDIYIFGIEQVFAYKI